MIALGRFLAWYLLEALVIKGLKTGRHDADVHAHLHHALVFVRMHLSGGISNPAPWQQRG